MSDVKQRAQIFLELAERNGVDWPTDADMMVAFHESELRRGQMPRCPKCGSSLIICILNANTFYQGTFIHALIAECENHDCDYRQEISSPNIEEIMRQFFPASGAAAPPPPVAVRELAKEIVRKFCFPTTDPDFPGTVAAEQVKAISEIINRALGQEDRASVCTKIYNSIPVQAYTIKCSACKQHMAVATAPTFCPACGEKFTEWRDESEPRA